MTDAQTIDPTTAAPPPVLAPVEASAPPAPPPLPPSLSPVAPEKGSHEWMIIQFDELQFKMDELQFKMDRIIARFM